MTASRQPLNFRKRLQRVRAVLAERELGGLLVTHLPNVRYLSGFTGSSALLLAAPAGVRLVTDSRYGEQAAEEAAEPARVRVARDGRLEAVAEAAAELEVRGRVAYESQHVTVRQREKLSERCPGLAWTGVEGLVESWRARKEPGEVERIRSAAELGDRVLEELLAVVEEGTTERALAAELDYRLRLAGSEGVAFDTIVAAGPRSALPHATPGARPLREGDLVLLDFGARVDGYCSDMTRTFVLGRASDWQREVHGAVRRAQAAAVEAVAPGVAASEVDEAAREVLREAGLEERFGHSTGHGLGLEVHEDPSLSRRSDATLDPGAVVTVEPGAYLPGRGGVRIEDDVSVEESGARSLTGFSRELREL